MNRERFYRACGILAYALTRPCLVGEGVVSVTPTIMSEDLKAVFEFRHRSGDAFLTVSARCRESVMFYKIQRISSFDEGCLLGCCAVGFCDGDWYEEICFCLRRVVLSRQPFVLIRLQRWFHPVLWAKSYLSVLWCL